jgi:hypothetical protein
MSEFVNIGLDRDPEIEWRLTSASANVFSWNTPRTAPTAGAPNV